MGRHLHSPGQTLAEESHCVTPTAVPRHGSRMFHAAWNMVETEASIPEKVGRGGLPAQDAKQSETGGRNATVSGASKATRVYSVVLCGFLWGAFAHGVLPSLCTVPMSPQTVDRRQDALVPEVCSFQFKWPKECPDQPFPPMRQAKGFFSIFWNFTELWKEEMSMVSSLPPPFSFFFF